VRLHGALDTSSDIAQQSYRDMSKVNSNPGSVLRCVSARRVAPRDDWAGGSPQAPYHAAWRRNEDTPRSSRRARGRRSRTGRCRRQGRSARPRGALAVRPDRPIVSGRCARASDARRAARRRARESGKLALMTLHSSIDSLHAKRFRFAARFPGGLGRPDRRWRRRRFGRGVHKGFEILACDEPRA